MGETGIMELAHLYHLRTIITAKDSTKSLVEWAKLLHPTPALGGEPREKAMASATNSTKLMSAACTQHHLAL